MAFVIVAVVTVVATLTAVVFFLGKNSADEERNEARQELATTSDNLRDAQEGLSDARAQIDDLEDEVAFLEEDLVTSEEIGTILGSLVTTGRDAADNLFTCADLSRDFIFEFLDTGLPNVAMAEDADAACRTAEESYVAFLDALASLEPVAE